MDTIKTILDRFSLSSDSVLVAPKYECKDCSSGACLVLGVESLKRHITDEGWQLQEGLAKSDYYLCGKDLAVNTVDVKQILNAFNVKTVVIQDPKEWDIGPLGFRDKTAKFQNIDALINRHDIFKVMITRDVHQRPVWYKRYSDMLGIHAWTTYYHPLIAARVAPYIRPEHLLRTYHSVNLDDIPEFNEYRLDSLISGYNLSSLYPLRSRIIRSKSVIPGLNYLQHPGYSLGKCYTREYLQILDRYKVSICTCSKYGYALRKIIESVICGCIAVTNLPEDEKLPIIDDYLFRISSDTNMSDLGKIIVNLYNHYDNGIQKDVIEKAKLFYGYQNLGSILANDIEKLRVNYNA